MFVSELNKLPRRLEALFGSFLGAVAAAPLAGKAWGSRHGFGRSTKRFRQKSQELSTFVRTFACLFLWCGDFGVG